MGHCVGFVAQIHDGMSYAPGNVDKCQIAQFTIGTVKTCCKLCREFKHQSRTFARNLAKTRICHFGDFAFGTRSDPGTASRLFIEQTHFTEELPFIQVSQHHLIAVFIFDHDFDRAINDVIENIGQIACVNHHGFRRYCPYAAVT
jgi:hypothetical protein